MDTKEDTTTAAAAAPAAAAEPTKTAAEPEKEVAKTAAEPEKEVAKTAAEPEKEVAKAAKDTTPPNKVEKKVLKQVEFYFSNSNLPNDKFLLAQVKSNDEGWVPIATIAKFKRMLDVTKELEVVVGALRKSSFLAVSEDGTQVRRTEPLPEKVDVDGQSVYAKGFPEDSTIDTIEEYFTKHLSEGAKVLSTRLRRFWKGDKNFKGSVFVEFSSPEEAKRIAALPLTKPDSEEKLVMQMKGDYFAKKKAEREQRKAEKAASGGGEGKQEEAAPAEPEEEKVFKKDLIVHIEGLTEDQGCSRESLKAFLIECGGLVDFVDYSRGQLEGNVRLAEDSEINATQAVKKITEEKLQLDGAVPTVSAMAGEEETLYWKQIWERKKNAKKNKRKGRGGGRGGRGKRQRH